MSPWAILGEAATITCFVAVMMILVEYANVLSVGRLTKALQGSRWAQYGIGALLGALPGCLGAFVLVTLYLHRSVRFGAVVTCMIATSGDESFVMLCTFPRTALLLTCCLIAIGIAAGVATDRVTSSAPYRQVCDEMLVHDGASSCRCLERSLVLSGLRRPSATRGSLMIGISTFAAGVFSGVVGPEDWGWARATLLGVVVLALFIVATTPEHFLEEHLWRHVVLRHVPRVFLWTLGSLLVIALLNAPGQGEGLLHASPWLALGGASALGLLPESGPHLLVVFLYRDGVVPFAVLLASSIVQDGHGALPLLAHSWRDFLKMKLINLVAGLLAGGTLLLLGG